MKKLFRALAVLLAAAMLLSLSAFAADFTPLADRLNTMGMFKGTEKGYELDRAMKRSEAAVMLVRLLGQESGAKADFAAGKTANPYADVRAKAVWLAPYVAWLYAHGLTNGAGVNAQKQPVFDYDGVCSAQMYCTFLLRALGYADLGAAPDFTYAGAVAFASAKGLIDTGLTDGSFLRDEAVAASYQALGTAVRGGGSLLLEKLAASGAVSESAAAAPLAEMKCWQAVSAAADRLAAQTSFDMTTEFGAQYGSVNLSYTVDSAFVDGAAPQYANKAVIDVNGQSAAVEQWYRDGWAYTSADGVKTKAQGSTFVAAARSALAASAGGSDRLYMYTGEETDATGLTYAFDYAARYNYLIDEQMESLFAALKITADVRTGSAVQTVALNSDGTLAGSMISAAGQVTIGGTTYDAVLSFTMKINKTGSAVTVAYPADLSAYTAQ